MNHGTLLRSAAVAALFAFGSCCRTTELKTGDMRGRLEFGFAFAVNVRFDAAMRVDLEGGVDLGAWAGVLAASGVALDVDIASRAAFAQTVEADVDDDGVGEAVALLAFGDDPARPARTFAAWRGDKYTFDEGRCYVLWWDEGGRRQLLQATCGRSEPALRCEAPAGGALACEVCDASGAGAGCDAEAVTDCVEQGRRELEGQGRAGQGGAGGQGAGDGGAGGAGGSSSFEFDTCLSQVSSLAREAERCGLAPPVEATLLCESRLSRVNVCFVSVQGAGVFGSACAALESDVTCGGIFP